jgi:hypothetical protein
MGMPSRNGHDVSPVSPCSAWVSTWFRPGRVLATVCCTLGAQKVSTGASTEQNVLQLVREGDEAQVHSCRPARLLTPPMLGNSCACRGMLHWQRYAGLAFLVADDRTRSRIYRAAAR